MGKKVKKGFGVEVSFKGDTTTLEQLFGSKPIMSTQMAKVIWQHIRSKQYDVQKDLVPKVGDQVKYYWKADDKWYKGKIKEASKNLWIVEDANGTYKCKRNEIMVIV